MLADIQDTAPPPSLDDAERAVRDARDYRDEAQGYATTAGNSVQDAQTAEQNAQGHAQAASTSESNAADSAQAAATSEQNASTSEGNASGFAQAASQSASAAATSEGNASDSAQAAAGSASAASTSAGNADDAKQAAEAAAQTATDKAGEASDSANLATAATALGYGVSIYNADGVDEGAYYAERSAAADSEQSRVYIEVIDGDPGGEVTVTLEVNETVVYGPQVVAYGTPHTADGLAIAVPSGASVNWQFTGILAGAREVFAKSYGKLT